MCSFFPFPTTSAPILTTAAFSLALPSIILPFPTTAAPIPTIAAFSLALPSIILPFDPILATADISNAKTGRNFRSSGEPTHI
ncbi:hypothetical protein LINPERHAP2_LOCUS23132 [Linum perenne]